MAISRKEWWKRLPYLLIWMKKATNYLRRLDKLLLFLCIITSGYGIVLIYSATFSYETSQYVNIQSIAVVLGIIVYCIVAAIPLEYFPHHWQILFVCNLLLLGSLYFFASGDNNSNWISIPGLGLSFQPAEIGKLFFIITLGRHMDQIREEISSFRNVLLLLLHIVLTVGFVVVFSKDDGMTLAYLFIALCMSFASGMKYRWFLAGGIAVGMSIPIIWNYV